MLHVPTFINKNTNKKKAILIAQEMHFNKHKQYHASLFVFKCKYLFLS